MYLCIMYIYLLLKQVFISKHITWATDCHRFAVPLLFLPCESLMIELCFWECIIWWLPVCDGPLFLNFRPVLMLLPSADIVRRKEIMTSCPLVCWVLWSQCSPVRGIEWVTWDLDLADEWSEEPRISGYQKENKL